MTTKLVGPGLATTGQWVNVLLSTYPHPLVRKQQCESMSGVCGGRGGGGKGDLGSILRKWQNKYHQRPAASLGDWLTKLSLEFFYILVSSFAQREMVRKTSQSLGLGFNAFATERPKGVSGVPQEDKSIRNLAPSFRCLLQAALI